MARKHRVSDQTIYGWQKTYGTLDAADVKRLRQLVRENARLKKLIADRDLELDVMREISGKNVGSQVRRPEVAYARQRELFSRRACALLSVARSTLEYRSRLTSQYAPVIAATRYLAVQYPRFGYRRIQVFLERQGQVMSTDRAHRLWRQGRLQVQRRWSRRLVSRGRPRPLSPTGIGHVWTYDFIFGAYATGQHLKCLSVLDEYRRECPAIDVAGSIRSGRAMNCGSPRTPDT